MDRKCEKGKRVHIYKLDETTLQALADSKTAVIISDVNIKNQVAISIVHIHIYDNLIIKTLYHIVNITCTKAKLFAIRCGINQAT